MKSHYKPYLRVQSDVDPDLELDNREIFTANFDGDGGIFILLFLFPFFHLY